MPTLRPPPHPRYRNYRNNLYICEQLKIYLSQNQAGLTCIYLSPLTKFCFREKIKSKMLKTKTNDCIGRESNPGRPRGRRAFYH